MTAIPLVKLIDVTKKYPNKLALSSVNLSILTGTTTVLQGTNGSGKSTLIKIIGGFISPTSGQRIVQFPQTTNISYAPDRFPKLKFSSVEYLIHMGTIHSMDKIALRQRITELHSQFSLQPDNRQFMRHYSKGMLQKVNMMQAILLQPDLLLLDEPLSGLDSATSKELVAVLKDLKELGVTIVLATHETTLVEQIADRIVTVTDGSIHEVDNYNASDDITEITCRFVNQLSISDYIDRFDIISFSENNGCFRYRIYTADCDAFLLALLTAGGSIQEVKRGKDV